MANVIANSGLSSHSADMENISIHLALCVWSTYHYSLYFSWNQWLNVPLYLPANCSLYLLFGNGRVLFFFTRNSCLLWPKITLNHLGRGLDKNKRISYANSLWVHHYKQTLSHTSHISIKEPKGTKWLPI